jgi:hypothetical protein
MAEGKKEDGHCLSTRTKKLTQRTATSTVTIKKKQASIQEKNVPNALDDHMLDNADLDLLLEYQKGYSDDMTTKMSTTNLCCLCLRSLPKSGERQEQVNPFNAGQ